MQDWLRIRLEASAQSSRGLGRVEEREGTPPLPPPPGVTSRQCGLSQKTSWVRNGAEGEAGTGGVYGALTTPARGSPFMSVLPRNSRLTAAWSSCTGARRCLTVNSAWTIKNTDVQIKVNQISPFPSLGTLLFFLPSTQ